MGSGYRRTRRLTGEREVNYLQELLAASARIRMFRVLAYASKQIRNLQPPLPPHTRIFLCQAHSFNKSDWLYPAVAELLEQVEPLNMDEAQLIGLELLQKIAAMREELHSYRDEDGTFRFTRAGLICYASSF